MTKLGSKCYPAWFKQILTNWEKLDKEHNKKEA